MDIDLLSKMVAELILDNDEVSLPGVGTFVAEIVPSTFSDKGYTINPPYRRLSFRQKESSDNRLVEFYALNNQLDTTTAGSILKDFLSEMKSVLMTKKVIVFPGLGRLRATRENNFFFIPDEDLNIYPDGYGLEPVSLKTHEETEDDVLSAVSGLQAILEDAVPAVSPDIIPEDVVLEIPAAPVGETVSEAPVQNTDSELPAEACVAESPTETLKAESPADVPEEIPAAAKKRTGWKIVAAVLIAALILFVLFMLLSRVAPDLIDRLLYSEEELQIIRTFEK